MNQEVPPGPTEGRPAFVPHQPNWKQRVVARLIYTVISLVAATLRYRRPRDPHALPPEGRPYIFCAWHNRLVLSLVMYRQYVKSLGQPSRMAAMVSASRDGALLTRLLELFGVQPARRFCWNCPPGRNAVMASLLRRRDRADRAAK
jgi:lysophospholipid acyltransferase (LPLAT)-like uncharacterized protein